MKKESIIKSIRMDLELVDRIELLAEEQNRKFSNMVETLLFSIMDMQPKNRSHE